VSVTIKQRTSALPNEASVMRDYFVYLLIGHTSRDAVRPNLNARYSMGQFTVPDAVYVRNDQ
jgi:hypothetical protein